MFYMEVQIKNFLAVLKLPVWWIRQMPWDLSTVLSGNFSVFYSKNVFLKTINSDSNGEKYLDELFLLYSMSNDS
jgi:hypothetical protein